MSQLLTHTSLFMSSTVLHFVIMIIIGVVKRSICMLLLAPLVGALMGCDGAYDFTKGESEAKISEYLPDGSGMLSIELLGQEGLGGELLLLDLTSDKRRLLYSTSSSNDLRMRLPIWGNLNCDEPNHFSPQGFDLAQRPSGRWQLLVVNHGIDNGSPFSDAADTVEMFELQKNDIQEWALIWRGCVETPAHYIFQDVSALEDGFLLSPFFTWQEKVIRIAQKFIGRNDESLWRWRLRDGFQLVQSDEVDAS